MEAQEDESFPGQPKSVYEALTCPKKYICLPRKRVLDLSIIANER
jgi:hypothetical protein